MKLPKYYTLIFADEQTRILDLEHFAGKKTILWLLGIESHPNMKKSEMKFNDNHQLIYFKEIMPILSEYWDIYLEVLKYSIIKDESQKRKLILFNNMIGGDSKIDSVILKYIEHKKNEELYNPINPTEDIYVRFDWRPCHSDKIAEYSEKWNVTGIGHDKTLYPIFWMRKKKETDSIYNLIDLEKMEQVIRNRKENGEENE